MARMNATRTVHLDDGLDTAAPGPRLVFGRGRRSTRITEVGFSHGGAAGGSLRAVACIISYSFRNQNRPADVRSLRLRLDDCDSCRLSVPNDRNRPPPRHFTPATGLRVTASATSEEERTPKPRYM